MSWAVGFDPNWKRDVGYGVPAECDHPECTEQIDRGLGFVCGGQPFGGEYGCGLYFCGEHLGYGAEDEDGNEVEGRFCERCLVTGSGIPFEPKPDTQEWTDWKMTDPSWAQWRAEQEIKS